jgi:hypothetical protein
MHDRMRKRAHARATASAHELKTSLKDARGAHIVVDILDGPPPPPHPAVSPSRSVVREARLEGELRVLAVHVLQGAMSGRAAAQRHAVTTRTHAARPARPHSSSTPAAPPAPTSCSCALGVRMLNLTLQLQARSARAGGERAALESEWVDAAVVSGRDSTCVRARLCVPTLARLARGAQSRWRVSPQGTHTKQSRVSPPPVRAFIPAAPPPPTFSFSLPLLWVLALTPGILSR